MFPNTHENITQMYPIEITPDGWLFKLMWYLIFFWQVITSKFKSYIKAYSILSTCNKGCMAWLCLGLFVSTHWWRLAVLQKIRFVWLSHIFLFHHQQLFHYGLVVHVVASILGGRLLKIIIFFIYSNLIRELRVNY